MKHLFSTWAILLFALFIVVPNSFATKRKAQHVVLIGLDGWGAYRKSGYSQHQKRDGEWSVHVEKTFGTPLVKRH